MKNTQDHSTKFLIWILGSIILIMSAIFFLENRYIILLFLVVSLIPLLAIGLRSLSQFKTSFSYPAIFAAIIFIINTQIDLALYVVGIALLIALAIFFIRRSNQNLINSLTEQSAPLVRVLRLSQEELIAYGKVVSKDRIIVRPGEKIAVDGRLLSHSARVRLAYDKETIEELARGDFIVSGNIAVSELTFEASNVGQESTWIKINNIIRALLKQKPLKLKRIDQICLLFQALWLIVGLVYWFILREPVTAAWFILIGIWWLGPEISQTFTLRMLVKTISRGVIYKNWLALENAKKISGAVFDKTGTITTGLPHLMEVKTLGSYSREDVLRVAAALEHDIDHPIARSIKHAAEKDQLSLPLVDTSRLIASKGIAGEIEKEVFSLGNAKLMEMIGAAIPSTFLDYEKKQEAQGATVIYLAAQQNIIAMLVLKDIARPSAENLLNILKRSGFVPLHLVSGDKPLVVQSVAKDIGLEAKESFTQMSAQTKSEHVKKLLPTKIMVVAEPDADRAMLKQASLGLGFLGFGPVLSEPETQVLIRVPNLHYVLTALKVAKYVTAIWWLGPTVTGLVSLLGGITYLMFL